MSILRLCPVTHPRSHPFHRPSLLFTNDPAPVTPVGIDLVLYLLNCLKLHWDVLVYMFKLCVKICGSDKLLSRYLCFISRVLINIFNFLRVACFVVVMFFESVNVTEFV